MYHSLPLCHRQISLIECPFLCLSNQCLGCHEGQVRYMTFKLYLQTLECYTYIRYVYYYFVSGPNLTEPTVMLN